MARNSFSIPNASVQLADLQNAETEWNNSGAMLGAPFFLGNPNPPSDTSVSTGDGQWEVAIVPSSAIDGKPGRTLSLYGVCLIGCNDADERDVLISASNIFGNPDESLWDMFAGQPTIGRDAFLHEWGHALGLDHVGGFSVMRSPTPLPRVGGSGTHVTPFGDERNGVASMYSGPFAFKNLAASAARLSGGALTTTTYVGTISVVTQATIDMRWTVANLGTQNLTFDTAVHLNTCPTCFSGGIGWFNWNGGTVNNRAEFTWSFSTTIAAASLSCGTTYWVFHTADASQAHSESRELDNVTHHAITIRRTC